MKRNKKSFIMCCAITKSMRRQLVREAKNQNDRSVSSVVRLAIHEYLKFRSRSIAQANRPHGMGTEGKDWGYTDTM